MTVTVARLTVTEAGAGGPARPALPAMLRTEFVALVPAKSQHGATGPGPRRAIECQCAGGAVPPSEGPGRERSSDSE